VSPPPPPTHQERDRLKDNVNMGALAEYRAKEVEYQARIKELDEATAVRNGARHRHDELRRKRLEEFMGGFTHITLKLKEMYQMLTLGGDAEVRGREGRRPCS
jgi:structural maintenance of chromosome 4